MHIDVAGSYWWDVRWCVLVCVATPEEIQFPSVLLQPLRHLSVFEINNLRAVGDKLSHAPRHSLAGNLDPPVSSATCGDPRTNVGRILCKTSLSPSVCFASRSISSLSRGPSGPVRVRRMHDQLERPAVTESNGGEMTHVARGQSTDAERLGQRHDR